jgi:[acyl-carrier-protein] S-malonyltransferase
MLAFVFPGQGSQAVGMGKDLAASSPAAASVYERADEALGGAGISRTCFEGPEEALLLTANQQPAIFSTAVAAFEALREALGGDFPRAAFMAGHSLGEYAALYAAGALSVEDGVRTVRARGLAMQDAVPAGVGAMAAVIGLEAADVEAGCAAASAPGEPVSAANFNGGGQVVIAGHAKAVARAGETLKARGAKRILQLKVSAPFHCALMEPAARRLGEALGSIEIGALATPVVTNVEAMPNADRARVKDLLVRQVTSPVRWEATVRFLGGAGVRRVVEVGPGTVLAGLVKRIDKSIDVLSVGDKASLDKATEVLRA